MIFGLLSALFLYQSIHETGHSRKKKLPWGIQEESVDKRLFQQSK
ncbi:hypothetical protein KIS1582_2974 [Cytobacillus firmus]|uniref:Uncharacterized protein n=1 Tax=Cytobacillus firmus TaxID=1399 RepID=A0A800NA08_CYTFI|nr:hypothetical protein KIS1582_2974 [Cytobacillus firmus]